MRYATYAIGVLAAWLIASALGAATALGPMRWIKGDWTLATVAAGLATAALIAGLVWLGVRSSRRRWLRIIVFVAAVPLIAIAALPVGIATWAAHPAHADLTATRPAGAVDVDIPLPGGDMLAAWYIPSSNGAAVVLSHGGGCTRDGVLGQARVLADAGYGVMMVDARGHGESTGVAMDLGWWGEQDITAALDVLGQMADVDPQRVGLVGLSMGAEESIGAAGIDGRIRAVVAEGATARTADDKSGWLPGGVPGAIQRAMDDERDALLAVLTDAPRPKTLRAAASSSQASMLLITAGTVPDEAAAARWIAKGNDRIDVWTVDGASHTDGLSTRPDEWERRVTDFLDGALPKDEALAP